jgi:hypothetical protein
MRVAYGFDDVETNKALVSDAERLVSAFNEAIVPGRYLVNSFPSLGKIPDWFPGAGFKERFRELDRLNLYMLSSPFESAKKNLVSVSTFSFHSGISDITLSQKEGRRSAHPNMATDLIDKLQEENTPSWIGRESSARNVCGLAYLSMFSSISPDTIDANEAVLSNSWSRYGKPSLGIHDAADINPGS